MKIDEIKELMDAFEASSLSQLVFKQNNSEIRLLKGSSLPSQNNSLLNTSKPLPNADPASAEGQAKVSVDPPAQETLSTALEMIEAPLVGTFYRSSAPDAPPFVQENDSVEVGQTLAIIESMKMLNEIKAEVKGKIEKILPQNGALVEYGQALFYINTSK